MVYLYGRLRVDKVKFPWCCFVSVVYCKTLTSNKYYVTIIIVCFVSGYIYIPQSKMRRQCLVLSDIYRACFATCYQFAIIKFTTWPVTLPYTLLSAF